VTELVFFRGLNGFYYDNSRFYKEILTLLLNRISLKKN